MRPYIRPFIIHCIIPYVILDIFPIIPVGRISQEAHYQAFLARAVLGSSVNRGDMASDSSSLQAEQIKLGQAGRGELGPTFTIPAVNLLERDGWCHVSMQNCRLRAVEGDVIQCKNTTAATGFRVFALPDPAEDRMRRVLRKNLPKTGSPDPLSLEVYFCSGVLG